MSTFAVRLSHSSDQCPAANSKVRDMAQKMGPEIPTLSRKAGVNIVAGPYVLGTEHEAIAIVEADRPEAVQDFLYSSGLVQWNSAKVSLVQPIAEAMGELAKLPSEPLY